MSLFAFSARKTLCAALAAGTVLALSACSGEPSNSDVEAAVKASIQQSADQARKMSGGVLPDSMLPQFFSARKIACAPAQPDPGFNCDVEIDASYPIVGRSKDMKKLRMVKGDSGWMAVSQ